MTKITDEDASIIDECSSEIESSPTGHPRFLDCRAHVAFRENARQKVRRHHGNATKVDFERRGGELLICGHQSTAYRSPRHCLRCSNMNRISYPPIIGGCASWIPKWGPGLRVGRFSIKGKSKWRQVYTVAFQVNYGARSSQVEHSLSSQRFSDLGGWLNGEGRLLRGDPWGDETENQQGTKVASSVTVTLRSAGPEKRLNSQLSQSTEALRQSSCQFLSSSSRRTPPTTPPLDSLIDEGS
ncbi:hypothetical protein THAOC_19475 [Thalassiosira oceanica]|uniref:Uncharacterized protein n=1 Tax=Thalassiosira oceanica TaxID=159749 RepID=K0S4R1_THAOC|nr:hypothetical protein THAOC_19475 [Thalassiosira oceanica]|eukprot:EJK60220.1 hypothetical protein THAOC_19475 [Thalassiosira oceanica]